MSTGHRILMVAVIGVCMLATRHGGNTAAANEPPVAEAGLPRYAAKDPVRLDGSRSYDPDQSGSLAYAWKQISGPTVGMTGADTVNPTISGFVQTTAIQICEFELVVGDGETTSRPDDVQVIIVPTFGETSLVLENDSFDPNKPTFVYFGGGDCTIGYTGQHAWYTTSVSAWTSKANIIDFPNGYGPDADAHTYYKYGDMIIAYLSAQAPHYRQAIQTSGWSTGGQPAIDVAIRMNQTYGDARYAVNRVTFMDATPYCRDYEDSIRCFLTSSVDGEQCWIDNYVSTPLGSIPENEYPGLRNNVLNLWFDRGSDASIPFMDRHCLAPDWYEVSIAECDVTSFNQGVVAGGYWSVLGPGKHLQIAATPDTWVYSLIWYGDVRSGHIALDDESQYPGKLPEPVTLIGPEAGVTVDAEGAVLSCQPNENAVGYQLLVGADPDHMIYLLSDTGFPPTEPVMSFPCEQVHWTVRAYDIHGSTIYADPRLLHVGFVEPQSIRNAATGQVYPSIQQAINDARNGDEIVLGAGFWRYLENLDFKGKSITLRSSDPNDVNTVAATIIVANRKASVVTLSSGGNGIPVLDGLTLKSDVRAVLCGDAAPIIRNCVITSGGPIAIDFWEGYKPTITGCTISGEVVQMDDPRIIAHWKLDELEGNIASDGVGGHDGTVIGIPAWLPAGGHIGGAMQFDGATLIAADTVLSPADGPFSVFAWVKGGAPGQAILSQQKGVSWLLSDPATGALMTELQSGGRSAKVLCSNEIITDGAWHRVGFTWDGASRRLYVDDILVAEAADIGLAACYGGLNIGCGKNGAPGTFWSGLIDDVGIYDRVVQP